mgnify:CR=1 FL=1
MQLELISSPNWVFETHAALALCMDPDDDSLPTLARRFQDQGDERALAYTRLLQQSVHAWQSQLELPEELRFLYRPLTPGIQGEHSGCLADDLFGCMFDPAEQDPNALCRRSLQAFAASNGREFIQHATAMAIGLEDDAGPQPQAPLDPVQVPAQLEKCGLPADAKWDAMKVYLNYEHYCRLLYKTLERFLPTVRQALSAPIAQEALHAWNAFWGLHLQQGDLSGVLARMVKVDLASLEFEHACLYPGLVRFNWCTFNADSLSSPRVNLLIGLVFQRDQHFFDVRGLTQEQLCSQLKLLSDKSKFEILRLIKDTPAYGQELAAKLGLTTATISHHMSALLNCGLVRMERQANRLYYRLDKGQLDALLEAVRRQLG